MLQYLYDISTLSYVLNILLLQPQLITSSNTMDKKTLLKASTIIGGADLSSHSTGSFKGFYSSDQPLSPPILVSPVQPGNKQLQSHLDEDDDPENMLRGYINTNNIM